MSPNDPRHGQVRGYRAGCRHTCCRNAIARYNQTLKLHGPRVLKLVDATGTRRRLRALHALGWSFPQLERHSGFERAFLRLIARDKKYVSDVTEARILDLYDALSMRLPPENTTKEKQGTTRSRNYARRMGWLPPLALDDDRIDDPAYRPTIHPSKTEREQMKDAGVRTDYDHAVVELVVTGKPRPRQLTSTEAAEVYRRLRAAGHSTKEIEDRWRIKSERYTNTNQAGDTAA